MMKVIIVDDEKAMHLIMKRMLGKIKEVQIVGSFQETTSAFSFVISNKVDLIFVDINMPRENGLDFVKRLREYGSHTKMVFVTSHKEYALTAFRVYAYDYMVKPILEERLRETIQRALAENGNEELLGMTDLKPFFSIIEPLTKREIEVIQFISDGMTNKEIAVIFKISEGTVKNHVVHIYGKLQVKNRVQAVAAAKEHRLIN